jgi:sugar/nucleoside kinase (ribokinase family)
VLSNDVDLLVLGGLGVDIAARVPALPLPAADSVTVPVDLRIGNTGAGVALAARAIGLTVAVVDTVGDDPSGDVVRVAVDRAGIETELLPDRRGTRRSVSLIDPAGRRMALYDPRGAWSGPPPLDAAALLKLVGRARHVHVSIMDWMLDLLPALPEASRPVSTDLHDWDGSAAYHRPFAAAADLVFVSGARLPKVDAALTAILGLGRASFAAATLGERGARLLAAGGPVTAVPAASPPGAIVDTNGAGDAFVAGFLTGRLRGWPPAQCARYAATVAAAACTHHGMEYPAGVLPLP